MDDLYTPNKRAGVLGTLYNRASASPVATRRSKGSFGEEMDLDMEPPSSPRRLIDAFKAVAGSPVRRVMSSPSHTRPRTPFISCSPSQTGKRVLVPSPEEEKPAFAIFRDTSNDDMAGLLAASDDCCAMDEVEEVEIDPNQENVRIVRSPSGRRLSPLSMETPDSSSERLGLPAKESMDVDQRQAKRSRTE